LAAAAFEAALFQISKNLVSKSLAMLRIEPAEHNKIENLPTAEGRSDYTIVVAA
jgi:hypothetical protein